MKIITSEKNKEDCHHCGMKRCVALVLPFSWSDEHFQIRCLKCQRHTEPTRDYKLACRDWTHNKLEAPKDTEKKTISL